MGAVLLDSVGSWFARALEMLLIGAGFDLFVTGALGDCPLYRKLGHLPKSLRSRPRRPATTPARFRQPCRFLESDQGASGSGLPEQGSVKCVRPSTATATLDERDIELDLPQASVVR